MKILVGIISACCLCYCLLYLIQCILFNIKEGKLIKYLEIHNETINKILHDHDYELILANYLGKTPTMIFLESKKENGQNIHSGDLSLEEIYQLIKNLKYQNISPVDFIKSFKEGEKSERIRNKAKKDILQEISTYFKSDVNKLGIKSIKIKGNNIYLVLTRPGLFIGKHGKNIEYLTHRIHNFDIVKNPRIYVEESKLDNYLSFHEYDNILQDGYKFL